MPQDFSGQNLQGRSFKGQDLTGINFSDADIRGADFTNAILRGASFRGAKAGLQGYWVLNLVIALLMLSALSGAVTALTAWFAGNTIIAGKIIPEFLASLITLITLAAMYVVTVRLGLQAAALTTLPLAVLGTVTYVLGEYVLSKNYILSEYWLQLGRVAIAIAWTTAGTLLKIASSAVFGVAFSVVFGVFFYSAFGVILEVATALPTLVGLKTVVVDLTQQSQFRSLAAVIVGAWLGGYIAKLVLTKDNKYVIISKLAIAFATTGGTSFRNADLTNANFMQATLKSTNFIGAILARTYWFGAKKLNFARVGNSILANPCVRDLLVSGNGYSKSYEGANLKEANLTGANLNKANLREADISQATLHQANLEEVNLTKAQAIGTDLTDAYLTGACLEAWNIDSTTKLEQVNCRYVYLLQGRREPRPSSGEFQSGEFTKLFCEVLNTVDLIIRNGVDWKAFSTAFNKVKVENEDTDLEIQSIENKGDGVVVVKVSVPPDANKEKIHSDFTQNYNFFLNAIEEKCQAKLEAKDELIISYRQQLDEYRAKERQQNADMKEIISLLASRPVNVPVNVPEIKAIAKRESLAGNLVILTLGEGDFERGFLFITAQIWKESDRIPTQCIGQLPPAPEIIELYSRCISIYKGLNLHPRIKPKSTQVINFSIRDIDPLAQELKQLLNKWLNSETFRPINNMLREKFMTSDNVLLIIQSEKLDVQRLPWHLWDFFKSYNKAEVALSIPFYDRVEKTVPNRAKKRILAILGDSTGINVEEDRRVLENLHDAETKFLDEPNPSELDKLLWDENGWDIFCFSGHSSSQWDARNGCIYINKTDKLMLDKLENALRAAIERGLQLAIFNSCNGLGLATYLASLHIPQIIVMREPVPDLVAQEFLKYFLKAFASGKSFYAAVREARERLQGLENKFPCATWLPVICQNPAEIPMIW